MDLGHKQMDSQNWCKNNIAGGLKKNQWEQYQGSKKCQTCGKKASQALVFNNPKNNLYKCSKC